MTTTQGGLRDRAAQAANGTTQTQEVATFAGEPAPTIARFVQSMQPEIARALPRGLDPNRMARLALTAIRNNPDLAVCSPQSFAGALLTASALGLEVGTGEAHLVPYKRECTLIVDYRGLSKLFWQSPLAKHLDAQTVYSNDEFDYAYGLGQFLKHKPAKGNRGEVVCYYACAELTTGGSAFVVLSPDEVKELRGGKVGPSGKIADPMRWMERKTALRQLLKMLPKSTQLNQALESDEKSGTTLYAERIEDAHPAIGPTAATQIARGAHSQTGEVGEVPESAPTTDDPTSPDQPDPWAPMTDKQRGKMFALFGELGITDDEMQRQYIADVLQREVSSRGDLTLAECARVIDRLESDGDH